ncbi:MAG: GNAT family N-acetyltransferase [Saccharospirillaceae bacterium]|nr:GNAT family N-acetyltransferase [Saccharospirillaceae bacterium]MCD8531870.1 GNAT family N-acetyltransferase [Saccharospirillaceae bacterium]
MEIETTNWREQRDILRAIRERVFIQEQNIPAALEWDADDADAVHFIARDGKRPVGCARLLSDGRFGRMAVLQKYRNQSWGSRLLRAVEHYYGTEMQGRILRATVQTQAYGFYHRNGFSPEPEFCWDAGIPHIHMHKVLGRSEQELELFTPGRDNALYVLEQPAAAEGLVQIASQSGPAAINITIDELNHPLWSDKTTLSSLIRYVRGARQRNIRVLIAREYAGIADHPLLQLQQRMSSRMQLRVYSAVNANQILMTPSVYISIDRNTVTACMNDRARVARLTDQFQEWWRSSQPCKEGRRLGL